MLVQIPSEKEVQGIVASFAQPHGQFEHRRQQGQQAIIETSI